MTCCQPPPNWFSRWISLKFFFREKMGAYLTEKSNFGGIYRNDLDQSAELDISAARLGRQNDSQTWDGSNASREIFGRTLTVITCKSRVPFCRSTYADIHTPRGCHQPSLVSGSTKLNPKSNSAGHLLVSATEGMSTRWTREAGARRSC
jgi:hypothetical protein